eukprot:NODE_3007_length_429_cov_556.663158_g2500_i0.p2 GENE.NODE_3007_length_429_cov_556.663158_g2500_i0~~NODE_3007_length_429_cov_556.663158_g2500_i0.p2  ORF type:complete len:87 (-),score=17.41 NODE_3007_length_429_cov_556.663158_g2500_i0:169-408(-)
MGVGITFLNVSPAYRFALGAMDEIPGPLPQIISAIQGVLRGLPYVAILGYWLYSRYFKEKCEACWPEYRTDEEHDFQLQ